MEMRSPTGHREVNAAWMIRSLLWVRWVIYFVALPLISRVVRALTVTAPSWDRPASSPPRILQAPG